MFGTDIALKHQVSEARFRDLLAEAERQRSVAAALDPRPRMRRAGIFEARAAVATLFLRAGSWLMPRMRAIVPSRSSFGPGSDLVRNSEAHAERFR